MVDQIDGPISLLEYASLNEESLVAFNKEGKGMLKKEIETFKKG